MPVEREKLKDVECSHIWFIMEENQNGETKFRTVWMDHKVQSSGKRVRFDFMSFCSFFSSSCSPPRGQHTLYWVDYVSFVHGAILWPLHSHMSSLLLLLITFLADTFGVSLVQLSGFATLVLER